VSTRKSPIMHLNVPTVISFETFFPVSPPSYIGLSMFDKCMSLNSLLKPRVTQASYFPNLKTPVSSSKPWVNENAACMTFLEPF